MPSNVTGTHCVKGHPMTTSNTYVAPDGHKECKQCNHDKHKRYRAEHKEDLAALMRARPLRWRPARHLPGALLLGTVQAMG